MKRTLILLTALLLAPLAALHAADKPNILFILADDLGYGGVSCYNDWAIRSCLLEQAFGGARTLSIRRGQWKYLDHPDSGGNRYDNNRELKPSILPDTAPGTPGQLCNLEADPGETKNLYFEQPQIVKELKRSIEQSKASGRSRPERPTSYP